MPPYAKPRGRRFLLVLVWFMLPVTLSSCAVTGIVFPKPGPSWTPTLSPADIAVVRQAFPLFLPAYIAPGFSPCNESSLLPSNFAPAEFFGLPSPQGMKPTLMGLMVESNGYDSLSTPPELPSSVTYFDCSGNPVQVFLSSVSWAPLNLIQQKLGMPQTSGAATIDIDLREARVSFEEIDALFQFVQQQLSIALPQVASVDPRNCSIIIQPTMFYVMGSQDGNTWAGGVTQDAGDGKYLVRVLEYHMNQKAGNVLIVSNWKKYLLFESMNYYLEAIGRPDLAF